MRMNNDRNGIEEIIALGEGFTTEFKSSVKSDLGREVCAFANANGGIILIGVDNDGTICGIDDHNRLKSEIQSTARSADPPIKVEIESAGEILCVRIPGQHEKPYSFGGKFFLRQGASSQQMSREEIREFFYKEGLIRFDETPCGKFSLADDLGSDNWALFRQRAKIPENMDPETALTNLQLIDENGRMTQAGAWLLARDIRKFCSSGDVSCALFMGTEKVRILDRRDFHNDIYSMIEETVSWILSKINVEYIIKHVRRDERPELPEEALREAVVNALAHRDYRSNANVQVYVFKNRVEIVNPGGLPAGMTEMDLGTKSIPRNHLLFSLLHRMEMVEKIGSGIQRIRNLCREHGVPEPVIEVSDFWVTTIFPRLEIQDRDQDDIKIILNDSKDKRQDRDQDRDQDNGQDRTKLIPSSYQIKVLYICSLEKSTKEIMALVGRTNRTKFRNQVLKPLLKARLLEMTMPEKPTSGKQKYLITAEGKEVLASQNIEN